jgi:hypothetical protein
MVSGRETLPRTSKNDQHPSYCSSVSADSLITWGLSRAMYSPSGVRTTAAARRMPELGGGDAHPLGEVVDGVGSADRGVQLGDDAAGVLGLTREVEGWGDFAEDRVAFLDDADSGHFLARLLLGHRRRLLADVGAEVLFEPVARVHRRVVRGPREDPLPIQGDAQSCFGWSWWVLGLSRHRCGSDLAMRTVEGLVERGFRDTP